MELPGVSAHVRAALQRACSAPVLAAMHPVGAHGTHTQRTPHCVPADRNIFRGKPEAFSLDSKALSWAQQAVVGGACACVRVRGHGRVPVCWASVHVACDTDRPEAPSPQADGSAAQLPAVLKYFLLMPYMHSEELEVQEVGRRGGAVGGGNPERVVLPCAAARGQRRGRGRRPGGGPGATVTSGS